MTVNDITIFKYNCSDIECKVLSKMIKGREKKLINFNKKKKKNSFKFIN